MDNLALIPIVFISMVLEIIFAKAFAEKLGIEKEAAWIKAALISTIISLTILFLVQKLFHYLFFIYKGSHFIDFTEFLLFFFVPIILRISTYSLASATWKKVPYTKKLFFCFATCGLVNLLLAFIQIILVVILIGDSFVNS